MALNSSFAGYSQPDDRALSERLAAELVDVGYASAEAGSSGFLVITPEGEQALRCGAS